MAKNDNKVLSFEDQRESAKRDARILAEAEVIKKDYERFHKATVIAQDMLHDAKEDIDALAEIATSILDYPSLEKDQMKKDLLA